MFLNTVAHGVVSNLLRCRWTGEVGFAVSDTQFNPGSEGGLVICRETRTCIGVGICLSFKQYLLIHRV
jgi:hypothetical protein